MRSRYQYRIPDLILLIVCWATGLAGTYTIVRNLNHLFVPAAIYVLEFTVCVIFVCGWLLGVRIANDLDVPLGWKRLGIIVLGWLGIPAPLGMFIGGGMAIALHGGEQIEVGLTGLFIFFISCLLFLRLSRLYFCAEDAWKRKDAEALRTHG